jgi:DNA-binding FrmR family transcriptional regulator
VAFLLLPRDQSELVLGPETRPDFVNAEPRSHGLRCRLVVAGGHDDLEPQAVELDEGQVRGLTRLVEMDRYCIDVVTQISAVRAALRAVEEEILADHVANCVEHAISSGNKAEERRKVAELMDVLSRASR